MITERMLNEAVSLLTDCKKSFELSCTADDARELIEKLRNERMILFHLGTVNYKYYPFQRRTVFYPDYHYSKEEYEYLISLLSDKVRNIKAQVMRKKSDLEKEYFIHDFFAKNVRYEDTGVDSHSIVGPLIYGRGVCDGISKSAKVLFGECGIECHVVNGTSRNSENGRLEPHSWNIVKIDGMYYHLDITYDNCASDEGICYDYFNLSSDEIYKDRVNSEPSRFYHIKCIKENDYFIMNSCYFTDIWQVENYCKINLASRKKLLYFRVSKDISEQSVKNTVTACLKAINCRISYNISVNSTRNVFRWEIEYK